MSLLVTATARSIADAGVRLDPRRMRFLFDKQRTAGLGIRRQNAKESHLQTLKQAVRTDRRAEHADAVGSVVAEILSAVAAEGDEAVRLYSDRLDGWLGPSLP